jgi:hypothetical protein
MSEAESERLRAAEPSVGIFWGVRNGSELDLVTDYTPLAQAKTYGDALTHPRGHAEVWDAMRHLGTAGPARSGLPSAIWSSEYDEHPRGRIVYDTITETFILYADRRLQTPAFLARIIAAFCLPVAGTVVRSDSHYRRS